MLETFMRRPGEVLSRFQLLEHAWDYEYENRSNVVDSYVRFLRRKIDRPFGIESIETVRGAGYRLREDGGGEPDPDPHAGHARLRGRDGAGAGGGRAVHLPRSSRTGSTTRSTTGCARARAMSRRSSRVRAAASGRRARRSLIEPDESFAQVLTTDGRVVDSTPQLEATPVLVAGRAASRHRTGAAFFEREGVPGIEGEARLLAAPADERRATQLVAVVGSSLGDRDEALSGLATLLLIGGPIALLLASLAGYGVAAARAASGRGDAAACGRDLGRRPRRAAAGPAGVRRDLAPRGDPQRDARPARGGARARAPLRRRRQPRAAHAARAAQDRARGRAAICEWRGRAARGDRRPRATEVDRLVQLAEDLLVVARSEEGGLALKRERVAVAALFESMRERFSARAAEDGRDVVVGDGAESRSRRTACASSRR